MATEKEYKELEFRGVEGAVYYAASFSVAFSPKLRSQLDSEVGKKALINEINAHIAGKGPLEPELLYFLETGKLSEKAEKSDTG